ncbi:MAG: hypothetical protein GY860_23670 [Desulfobacteraceae bacterium]|nr:hypothetical protein [Desulfobacteraceae bacterium]
MRNEVFHNLWVDDYALAMPLDHMLCNQDSVILQDLNGLHFISRKFCDDRDTWNNAIRPGRSGIQPAQKRHPEKTKLQRCLGQGHSPQRMQFTGHHHKDSHQCTGNCKNCKCSKA